MYASHPQPVRLHNYIRMESRRDEAKPAFNREQWRVQGGKVMDAFLEAFCALDVDNNEVISLDALRKYNQQHDIEEGFPETFLKLFGGDSAEFITLEQYCNTLGLIPKQAREFRRRRTTQLFEELLPSDLEIVHDDMELEIKVQIVKMLVNDLRESGRKPNLEVEKMDESVKKLKQYLEERYGKPWHIIISCNQQLAWFSYVPGFMFHFCLGRFAVLIWKTPAV